jgi:hypothetical protein
VGRGDPASLGRWLARRDLWRSGRRPPGEDLNSGSFSKRALLAWAAAPGSGGGGEARSRAWSPRTRGKRRPCAPGSRSLRGYVRRRERRQAGTRALCAVLFGQVDAAGTSFLFTKLYFFLLCTCFCLSVQTCGLIPGSHQLLWSGPRARHVVEVGGWGEEVK